MSAVEQSTAARAMSWPFLRIAHRGAAALEPENTLRAVERALTLGVEMVEVDVRPCGDGTLVVVHDDSLDCVAGVPLRVSDLSSRELRGIDVGKGERIPTLDDVLALVRGRALLNLDQKTDNLADRLFAAFERVGGSADVMLSGEAHATFAAVRRQAPHIPIALSIDARRRDAAKILLARRIRNAARGQAGAIVRAADRCNCSG